MLFFAFPAKISFTRLTSANAAFVVPILPEQKVFLLACSLFIC